MDNVLYEGYVNFLDKLVPQLAGNISGQFSIVCILFFMVYINYAIYMFIFQVFYNIKTYLNIRKIFIKTFNKSISYIKFCKARAKVFRLKHTREIEIYYELSCDAQEDNENR